MLALSELLTGSVNNLGRQTYSLQSLKEFQIQANPIHAIAFLVVFGATVGGIVFLSVSKKVQKNKTFQTGTVERKKNRKAIPATFGKGAKEYELSREEQKILHDNLDDASVDTGKFFENDASIDQGYNDMLIKLRREMEDETETEHNIKTLFDVRDKIDYINRAMVIVKSGGKKIPRRHRRITTSLGTNFSLVVSKEIKNGLKKEIKLVADSKVNTGTITDISAAGCAMQSDTELKLGSRIKLEFKIGKAKPAVLAEVVHIAKKGTAIMHLKFLKITTRSSNAISSLVYGYKDV
jgi:hypothetical protein